MTTTTQPVSVPTAAPPPWFNSMMASLLRTPGLQHWIGKAIALITVTGRRTGKTYTTPVSYYRDGNTVIVLTKKFRNWWRNLLDNPEVELLLEGRKFRGRARPSVGDPADLPAFIRFLENRRLDAKAYGVTFTPEGRVNRDEARRVLSEIVLVRITLD